MMSDAETNEITVADGIAVTDETPGFSPAELNDCPGCARANAPNRFACLYCGAELILHSEIAPEIQIRPAAIEPWERGYNVVYLSSNDPDINGVAAAVRLDESILRPAIDSAATLPLVRVARMNEAEAISKRLPEFGIQTVIIADNDLLGTRPPVRIRGIEFEGDNVALVIFNSDERITVNKGEIRLLVSGSIYERRESNVVKKGKSPRIEDGTTTVADFDVLDLFVGDESVGYRLTTNGFDFSCLGTDKTLMATQNFKKLAVMLESELGSARLDAKYRSLMKVLDPVWPPTISSDSKGVRRVGFKVERSKGEAVTNAEQFTKYSRLQSMCK